jgi:hypothetical protein
MALFFSVLRRCGRVQPVSVAEGWAKLRIVVLILSNQLRLTKARRSLLKPTQPPLGTRDRAAGARG